jgi:methionine salvage enolase-phosphatase E1
VSWVKDKLLLYLKKVRNKYVKLMDAKIRKVVSQLKKASQAHARQAAMLEKMIKSNGKTKKK